MFLYRKYATATHVYFPVVKRAVVDFAVGADWTPAAGDTKISIDGAAAANVTNQPAAIAMGNTAYWDISLTSGELTGKKMMITVADSATKAVEDQSVYIETYGNPSAEIPFDLSATQAAQAVASVTDATSFLTALFGDYRSGLLRTSTCQAGGSTSTAKLDASASVINDYYKGCLIIVQINAVTGTVSDFAWGICSAYDGTTKIATIYGTWTNGGSPAAADAFSIFAGSLGLTGADIADAISARNYQGGANSAPTFADVLAASLMKFDMSPSGATITVYHNDGVTVAFTRTVTRAVLDAMLKMV